MNQFLYYPIARILMSSNITKNKSFCNGINANAALNKNPVSKSAENNVSPSYEMNIAKYYNAIQKFYSCIKDFKERTNQSRNEYFLFYYNLKQMREPLKNMGIFKNVPLTEEMFNILLENEKLSAENKRKLNIRMPNSPENNVRPITKNFKDILYNNLTRTYPASNTPLNKNNQYRKMSPLMKGFYQQKIMDNLTEQLQGLLYQYEMLKKRQESKESSTLLASKGFFKRLYTGKSKMTVLKERTIKQLVSDVALFLIKDVLLNTMRTQRKYINEFVNEEVKKKGT